MAPTGSSIFSLRSMKNTDSMTRTPAIRPMTAAAHGATKAQGAVMATRPASMPLAIMPGSGLPVRLVIHSIAATAPKAPAIAVFVATVANWMSVAAKVEAALKPNQPNSRMNVPSMAIGMWWPGIARGVPSAENLPTAGPEDDRAGERRGTTDGVDDAGAGEVDVAGAEAHRVPGLARASRRPRSTLRTAGSRGRRRRGPRSRSCPTSTALPSSRSGWWRRCP